MATHRIKIVVNKKKVLIQTAKKEIATLLVGRKDEKACIRSESLIREDFTIEALEILEMLCDLCHERIKYISSNEDCPVDIKQGVCSLIYAANKVDIVELREVKSQFSWKYGSKFIKAAEENEEQVVNERIVQKLSVAPPSAFMVQGYLIDLSKEYDLGWEPKEVLNDPSPMQPPDGYSVPMAPGSGLDGVYKRSEAEVREEIEQLTMKAHELADQLPASHTTEAPPSEANAPPNPPTVSKDSSSNVSPSKANDEKSSPVVPTAFPVIPTVPPSTISSVPSTSGPATFTTGSKNAKSNGDGNGEDNDEDDGPDGGTTSGGTPSLEELEARFAALRR